MRISTDFIGANAKIEYKGDNVVVIPDLRDSECNWFYWAFCVEDGAGKTVTFEFSDETKLGRYGAAVSTDFVNWHWSMNATDTSFTYTFGENENKVWFAHHILYSTEQFDVFAQNENLTVKTLCTSKKGNIVPYTSFGDGENTIVLTARHHCCESSGSYTLEGVVSYLKEHLPSNLSVIVVPYMDFDGCVCGDQGKNRRPHDHNRDYIDNPLYNEVIALKKLTEDKKVMYAFDFHAPFYQGGRRDYPYIVYPRDDCKIDDFGKILDEKTSALPVPHMQANDVHYGQEWNKKSDTVEKFSDYFGKRSENKLAFTLENPYFGTENHPICADDLRNIGKAFAQAIIEYHKL